MSHDIRKVMLNLHCTKVQSSVQKTGRRVVITGCDTGFGHQLAKSLHLIGFTIFACCFNDRSDGALTLKKLVADSGRMHVIKIDVTNQEEVDVALTENAPFCVQFFLERVYKNVTNAISL